MSSLEHISRIDPGFDPDGLYTFAVSIPGTDYGWPEEAGRYCRSVQERVAALPGVESAGIVWPMPFGGSWSGEVEVDRRSLGIIPYFLATEEYFPTAGIPLRRGRLFAEGDPRYSVLISEAVARTAFPDGSAIGRTVTADPWGRGLEEYEVIGVRRRRA